MFNVAIKPNSFEDIVSKVVSEYKDKTIEEVNVIVEKICEAYVLERGKKPDSYQLTLLANLILKDDLSNNTSNKIRKEEYPFHSDSQKKRRNRQEFVTMDDTLEHMNFKRKTHLSTAPPRDIKL
jgi:hypothetical protein